MDVSNYIKNKKRADDDLPGPRNPDPVDEARIQKKILNYQPPKQLSPTEQDAATKERLRMRQREVEESRAADKVIQDQGIVTRGGTIDPPQNRIPTPPDSGEKAPELPNRLNRKINRALNNISNQDR